MSRITRLGQKELRYIIREFAELERLLRLAKKGVAEKAQLESQRILKSLERGLHREERVEYRLARNFLRFSLGRARTLAG